jgi:hypothetical protein
MTMMSLQVMAGWRPPASVSHGGAGDSAARAGSRANYQLSRWSVLQNGVLSLRRSVRATLRLTAMMPSIIDKKNTSTPSVFLPAALLREARRQKGLATVDVPSVCILDPDGDIVQRLRQTGQAQRFEGWPCYHTRLDTFTLAGRTVGILGCAVGATR